MSRSATPTLLPWFLLTLAASLMLYHTSDRVTALGRQLHEINTQIDQEQASIHVLKAEWVYLANPARVEATALRHLSLQPTSPNRVMSLHGQNLASLLPVHGGSITQIADNEIRDLPEIPSKTTVALSAPVPAVVTTVSNAPHAGKDRLFATINAGHINDHVLLQHGLTTQSTPDTIGALIGSMSLRP